MTISNPGSPESKAAGCTCPVMDNGGGRGYMGQPDMFVIVESCPVHSPTNNHGPQKSPASVARINAQTESTDREMLELIHKGPYAFWACPVCVNSKIKWEHKTDGRYLGVCLECGRTNRDRPIGLSTP